MEAFGRYRECRWRHLGDVGSSIGTPKSWDLAAGICGLGANSGGISPSSTPPPSTPPPSTSTPLHPGAPATPWSTSHTLEHQPHPGAPAPPWSTSHTLEHQPHPGAPATSWSTSHILEHPATSWSTGHTLEQKTLSLISQYEPDPQKHLVKFTF